MGRMNVGTSTLVNALVGEARVIVSEVPGTTRDAVDVPFAHGGRRYVAIDTAGLRKDKTISDSVEFYGQARAMRALRRADVVLLLLDATQDVGRIDRKLAGMVAEYAVPCVLVVSKWDLARERATTAVYEQYLRRTLPGLAWAPIAFIVAPDGTNLGPMLTLAAQLPDQAGLRVGTGEQNRVLQRAWERRKPRPHFGRLGRIYYGAQVGTHPPALVVFVNEPSLFDDNWRRYLVHELQAHLPYAEIPVKVDYQARAPGVRDSRGRGS
jgi:GTP-binding protein